MVGKAFTANYDERDLINMNRHCPDLNRTRKIKTKIQQWNSNEVNRLISEVTETLAAKRGLGFWRNTTLVYKEVERRVWS